MKTLISLLTVLFLAHSSSVSADPKSEYENLERQQSYNQFLGYLMDYLDTKYLNVGQLKFGPQTKSFVGRPACETCRDGYREQVKITVWYATSARYACKVLLDPSNRVVEKAIYGTEQGIPMYIEETKCIPANLRSR